MAGLAVNGPQSDVVGDCFIATYATFAGLRTD